MIDTAPMTDRDLEPYRSALRSRLCSLLARLA